MIDFVKASLTWLPSYDRAYFLTDSITLCSCGSHIEKWVSYDSTTRWQRLLCSGEEVPTLQSALLRRTSPVISIMQHVKSFLNSRRVFSSKLYSVKYSKVSTLLSVLSHVTFWQIASRFIPVEATLKNELVKTAQPGGSGCYAVGEEAPTLQSALLRRTSPVISIMQHVKSFLNSRRVFSSKLYSVK